MAVYGYENGCAVSRKTFFFQTGVLTYRNLQIIYSNIQ